MTRPTQPPTPSVADTPATLGQYLDHARTEAGMTIRQLAAATGIPKSTVMYLIGDKYKKPPAIILARVADTLNIPVGKLYEVADIPHPNRNQTIESLLKTEYGLPTEVIADIMGTIEEKVRIHRAVVKKSNRGKGE